MESNRESFEVEIFDGFTGDGDNQGKQGCNIIKRKSCGKKVTNAGPNREICVNYIRCVMKYLS